MVPGDASMCCTCWSEHTPDQRHRWVRYKVRRTLRRWFRKH